jgi:hypothetical protein
MAMRSESVELTTRRVVDSKSHEGVRFVVARMSFGRRVELMKKVRDLAVRAEFFQAGCDEKNKMEASLLGAEIDRLYVEWGLEDIRGLLLDGLQATPAMLIESGPEELFREVLEAVRSECGLSETERKN